MQLGVCYYPEQWPRERWATDAKMMREAGLSLVRLAEFAWTFMEPAEGRFEWEWLDKAIAYQDAGLSEILTENLFDKIHSDPRWLPFLRKIGKAPDQLAKIEFKVPPLGTDH